MSKPRTSIEHVITGLDTGGAEMMLSKLLAGAGARYTHSVTSLSGLGPVGIDLQNRGFIVRSLGMRKRLGDLSVAHRLMRSWRERKPGIVQTWLYHADLVGGVAGFVSKVPVVWNIRQSNLDRAVNKSGTLRLIRICAILSSILPCRIVCGSEAAFDAHKKIGFCTRKMIVIPNGFDLNIFRPLDGGSTDLRAELDVETENRLVGLVGRFDPQKDHRTFVKAAEQIRASVPEVIFVMVGSNIDWNNRELVQWIEEAGLRDRVRLLGRRDDVATIHASLDILVSSSRGEGFANVIGEAMACGTPCVVTDVGDSSRIVGRTGTVVSPGDPVELASACVGLLRMPKADLRRLGRDARKRIKARYDLKDIAHRYETLYTEVLDSVRHRRIH